MINHLHSTRDSMPAFKKTINKFHVEKVAVFNWIDSTRAQDFITAFANAEHTYIGPNITLYTIYTYDNGSTCSETPLEEYWMCCEQGRRADRGAGGMAGRRVESWMARGHAHELRRTAKRAACKRQVAVSSLKGFSWTSASMWKSGCRRNVFFFFLCCCCFCLQTWSMGQPPVIFFCLEPIFSSAFVVDDRLEHSWRWFWACERRREPKTWLAGFRRRSDFPTERAATKRQQGRLFGRRTQVRERRGIWLRTFFGFQNGMCELFLKAVERNRTI